MKKSKILNLGFYLTILIILFIGFFSLYYMNKFYEENKKIVQIKDFVFGFEHSIQNFWLLIDSDNFKDYNELKSEIEFKSASNEILLKEIYPLLMKFDSSETILKDLAKFVNISGDLIQIQNESIVKKEEFIEKAKLEKTLRHKFRDLAIETNNFEFTNFIWKMQYKSKQALYQYEDEEHLKEWLDEIESAENKIMDLNLPDKEKLLEDINLYEVVALEMGKIVIEQIKIEKKKTSKIQELQDASKQLGKNARKISVKIRTESKNFARNIFWIIITIIFVGIIFLFILKKYFLKIGGLK